MKDSKDFDVDRFAPDGSTTETTVATDDARPSKQSVPTAMSKPTTPTPSSGNTVKPRQTASTLPTEQSTPNQQTASAQPTESPQRIEPTPPTQSAQPRVSSRQRKASLDEYRETFMTVPKITDRQPVFVSRDVRDRIDSVVRRLGERKMSVSGFLENLARHHLDCTPTIWSNGSGCNRLEIESAQSVK